MKSVNSSNISFDNTTFKRNILNVKVYFENLNYKTVTEYPAYELFSYISDIGGILGLYIGFTALTCFEFVELFFDYIFILLSFIFTRHKIAINPVFVRKRILSKSNIYDETTEINLKNLITSRRQKIKRFSHINNFMIKVEDKIENRIEIGNERRIENGVENNPESDTEEPYQYIHSTTNSNIYRNKLKSIMQRRYKLIQLRNLEYTENTSDADSDIPSVINASQYIE
ncbi:hypothetical protein A3Q56_07738 [Intoshia linei]|uniref:Uncharacterized protein n=1 Tax=Intoshia linei TaxID=1819745 RepID=A0A177ATJ7_9BILA|nr:hypothetical protein A3Q56_07738 [Intoshia linei]